MGEHILIGKTAARAHFDSNVTFFCQKKYGTSFIANDFVHVKLAIFPAYTRKKVYHRKNCLCRQGFSRFPSQKVV